MEIQIRIAQSDLICLDELDWNPTSVCRSGTDSCRVQFLVDVEQYMMSSSCRAIVASSL
ncbi:hypothetical protein U1Q18_029216, partial [Sarracenia purpurea var. burkii]